MERIVRRLREEGCDAAVVADIHFVPEVAAIAAKYVDKVRINPGNYNSSHGEFEALIDRCRERGVAIRIGVNHGSLSKRVFDEWGDTPEGMVASAMEFLRVCREKAFDQVVVSMKSSNTRVMVAAYRLLAEAMEREGMDYPLHLGVTEAGNGIEGRIKSAVGIGALLADGIGDTIRVSLTEAPENEIPVAQLLVDHFARRSGVFSVKYPERYTPTRYSRRTRVQTPLIRLAGDRSPDRESYGRTAGCDPEPRPGGRTRRGVPPLRGYDGRSRRRQSRRRSGVALSGRAGGRHSDRRAAPFGKGDRGDRADDPAGSPRADVPHRIHRLPELRSYALRYRGYARRDPCPNLAP